MTSLLEKAEVKEQQAEQMIQFLLAKSPASPEELKRAVGCERLAWYSNHWRSVLALAKQKGMTTSGSGPHRKYFLSREG